MPTFTSIELTATVDVDFEVYCSCGAHMCNETTTRLSRSRRANQIVVNVCQDCIKSSSYELEKRIEELEELLKEKD